MMEFSLEDLARYDGKEGRPAYILHEGRIYDVSGSKMWKGGLHMRRHHAGGDLTTDIQAAPHGTEMLERYPQVGVLRREEVAEEAAPGGLSKLLARYPFLRRHPHPMTVHFPIVFMLSSTFFSLLCLATGNAAFDATAFHCLGAGLLFTPLVMLTGLFSWWLNYMAKPIKPVTIKLATSIVLFVFALTAFAWRAAVPDILTSFRAPSLFYLLLVLALAPLVGIVGWYGARLTFPIERE